MRKKPVVLGWLASATGLAVLGSVGAQTPAPGGVMPANANYGTPTTYMPSRAKVPPAAPSHVRPFSDWTPTPPPPGYVPPMPSRAGFTPPAGSGLGSGIAHTPPRPRMPAPSMASAPAVHPASGIDLPPPSFEMQSRMEQGVRPAGGGLPAPSFSATSPAMPSLPSPAMPEPSLDSKFPSTSFRPVAPEMKPATALTAPTFAPAMPTIPATPVMKPDAPAMPTFTPMAPTVTAVQPKPSAAKPATLAPLPTSGEPTAHTLAAPAVVAPGSSSGALPARLAPSVVVEAFAPETVNFGQEFKYDLLVRNTGPVAVSDVRISDDMPDGARYLSSDPPAEINGEHLSWSLGAIEAGADRRITVRIKPADEGEVRSRATVSFSTTVDARTRVTRPRLSVSLTGPEVARVGEEAAFIIKITNTGSGPASKMMLKATLSEGLFCPKVPAAGGNEIETTLADIKPGETKTIKLPVAAARAGMQGCQVVAATEGSPESTARVAVNVVESLLQIKQTGPAQCLVRSEPSYTIELSNPGTASTDPLALYTVLPDGFEHVQASDGGAYSPTTRAVTWRLPSLPAGGTRSVSLKVRAVSACDGLLRTLAQCGPETAPTGPNGVMAASAQAGGRSLEAKAETQVRAEGVPAIRFEVFSVEGVVEVGKEAVYEIRVSNQGTGACSNVQLVAAVAEGMTYTGSNGPTAIKAQGQQLVFDPIPTLGVKGEMIYRLRVRGTAPGESRLRVQLTCDQVTNPVVKEESTRFYQQ